MGAASEVSGGRRWQYSPQVTLGNLLTIVALLAGAIGVWGSVMGKMAVIEERTQQLPELRKSVDLVKDRVEDVGRRVEVLWDRSNKQKERGS